MKITITNVLLLMSTVFLSCTQTINNATCLQITKTQKGDTLVIENKMDGFRLENFNFIMVTEKYLQGITEDSIDYKLRVEIYTELDSTNRRVDAYVLKTNKSDNNFIDHISWVQDESSVNAINRSIPYIIHPVTGKFNRIKDGIVIRNSIDKSHANKLIQDASKVVGWNEYEWEEKSPVNFSVELLDGERKVYYWNCKKNIPKTISTVLKHFGIEQSN